jgi:signal transduction histidine kinase
MSTRPAHDLRRRSGLRTLRSILIGIVVVASVGIVGAVITYRADVAEARLQVRERVGRQARASADALAQHVGLLATDLALGQPLALLGRPDPELLAVVRDDRALLDGGLALLGLDGVVRWSEPADALRGVAPTKQPWFRRLVATDRMAVDALGDDGGHLVIALPARHDGKTVGVHVGVIAPDDALLTVFQGEQIVALTHVGRVVLPREVPGWTRRVDLEAALTRLAKIPHGTGTLEVDGEELIAELAEVRGTQLRVLAVESEHLSVAVIQTRLNQQLGFLMLLQLVSLSAFFFFLRSTYRTFVEVEQRIAEQEKMVALGTAASLIAHELKNSLNGLKAAASLVETAGPDGALVSRTVRGQVERLAHLATSLLSFARPAPARKIGVVVDQVVRDTVAALRVLPEHDEAPPELTLGAPGAIESDPLLLTTAVDNLVRNAIEAAVAAKDVGAVERPQVHVETHTDAEQITILVRDNGVGAPEAFETRLGEPFFTTKSRGVGLGLTMTRRAIEQLGGSLHFERRAQGSCFEIRLPTR